MIAKKKVLTALMIICCILMELSVTESFEATTSYTNAKEFYENTGQNDGKHIDIENGIIYFATKAKLAASSKNTRYITLGFDITLIGNGKSVSFAVKRGGSLEEVPKSGRVENGYEYLLYQISTDSLYRLARATGNANTSTVLNAAVIYVRMDAIMSTKKGNTVAGSIKENGSGGLTESSAGVYHLKKSSDLSKMKSIFSGHSFETYIDIEDKLENYQLTIMYNVGAGAEAKANGYGTGSFSNGSTTINNMLYKKGSVVKETYKVLEKFTLLDTGKSGINLYRKGYHLGDGNGKKQWKRSDNIFFHTSNTYGPKDIVPQVGYGNKTIVLYANWNPNEYTILYNANGGKGAVSPSKMKYDMTRNLPTNNLTRVGYYLPEGKEWNTKADGTGTSYSSGEAVKNLTDTNGTKITLYANWKPLVVMITADKQEGIGGTNNFFEKYGKSFYSNQVCTSSIVGITIPDRKGYEFQGYYSNMRGRGEQIINKEGLILKPFTYFIKDTTIFANWIANQFLITFDKQGGTSGSNYATVTYNKLLPPAEGPIKEGYTFKGYYLDKSYEDETQKYYTQYMSPTTMFLFEKDITLYAKWIDDILPTTSIEVSSCSWTNAAAGIKVSASAYDLGSGLSKVELYCEDNLVNSKTNLNGTNEIVGIEYIHLKEGSYRYKVVAYDMDGNMADAYEICLYDITEPFAEFEVRNEDVTNFNIIVDVSDYNIP